MRTPGPLQLQQHHPCFKLQLRHKADRTSSAIGASRPRALRHLWMNRPRFPSPSSCRPYRGEQTCRASDYHRPWPRKRHSDRRDCFTLLNIKTFTIGSLAVHCAAPETRRGFPGLNRGVWVSFPRMGRPIPAITTGHSTLRIGGLPFGTGEALRSGPGIRKAETVAEYPKKLQILRDATGLGMVRLLVFGLEKLPPERSQDVWMRAWQNVVWLFFSS